MPNLPKKKLKGTIDRQPIKTRTFTRVLSTEALFPRVNGRAKNLPADNYLNHHAVQAIVSDFAQTIAALDAYVFEERDGVKVRIDDHPATKTLANPSARMPGFDQRGASVVDYFIEGEAFLEVIPTADPTLSRRKYPYLEIPQRGSVKPTVKDGLVTYTTTRGEIGPEGIVHVKMPSVDGGTSGSSLFTSCRQALDLAMAAEAYATDILEKGGIPAGFLVSSEEVDAKQARSIRKTWKKLHAGPNNRGEIGLLWGSLRFEKTGLTPDEVQLNATQEYAIRSIARIFRYPASYLLGTPPTEEDRVQFFRTVRSHLEPFEAAYTFTLLSDEDKAKGRYIEFDTSSLNRISPAQIAAITPLLDYGLFTVNETRNMFGYPPTAGGDVRPVAVNNIRYVDASVPLDSGVTEPAPMALPAPATEPAPTNEPSKTDAQRAAIEDVVGRLLRRARKNVAKAGEDVEAIEAKEMAFVRTTAEVYCPAFGLEVEAFVAVMKEEVFTNTAIEEVVNLMEVK